MIIIFGTLGGPIVVDGRVDARVDGRVDGYFPTNEGLDLVMGTHRPPHDRPDLHNASVDERVATSGGCGQVHLPSGRTCTLDQDHAGSCHFVAHVPS
jgi:hypothetical protein